MASSKGRWRELGQGSQERMCNLCKVLPSAKGMLQSLDLRKLRVCLVSLESATALSIKDFAFGNDLDPFAFGKVVKYVKNSLSHTSAPFTLIQREQPFLHSPGEKIPVDPQHLQDVQ